MVPIDVTGVARGPGASWGSGTGFAHRYGGPVDASDERTGVWTVVVAGGSGRRFGAAKQYEPIAGRRVLDRSVDAARSVSEAVVVVVPAVDVDEESERSAADVVVAGGPTRSDSVRAGLAAVPADAPVVLVHDAARPLASAALFRRVAGAVRAGAPGVVPAVAVVDTLRRLDGGVVDRSELAAVQTPQGFDAAVLRAAHAGGGDATDDAGLVEAAGWTITLVDGERHNLKVTDPSDLAIAEALLARGIADGGDST